MLVLCALFWCVCTSCATACMNHAPHHFWNVSSYVLAHALCICPLFLQVTIVLLEKAQDGTEKGLGHIAVPVSRIQASGKEVGELFVYVHTKTQNTSYTASDRRLSK